MQRLVCLAFRLVFILAVFLAVLAVPVAGQLAGCAARQAGSSSPGAGAAHPPRPATCELTMLHAPAPDVADWDDLGVAEVVCHIDIGLPQCLRQFRAEACRMGADIVYDLPPRPERPREQTVLYRGRVAHSRVISPTAPPGQ